MVIISLPSFPEYEYATEEPSFINGKGLPCTFSHTSFRILGVIDVLNVSLFMALEGLLVSVIWNAIKLSGSTEILSSRIFMSISFGSSLL